MKYYLEWLITQFEEQESLDFLFFWGHQPRADGILGKTCFSQWWQLDFVVDHLVYKTAEHWMMAQKARLFEDNTVLEKIIACRTPGEAKKLGRQVSNFDPQTWDNHKYEIVKTGNFHKFSQHPDLKDFLLNTGIKIIVEASPRDNIWGIGMAESNPNSHNPNLWKGQNLLGFALMEVRDELLKKD